MNAYSVGGKLAPANLIISVDCGDWELTASVSSGINECFMAEGSVNEAAAVLAEGGTVNQTVEGGTINVVAGDQVYGSRENIHNDLGMDTGRQGTATAMLAEGEHVDQRFTKSDVNVVAGDQIHGNVHNTYYIQQGPNYPYGGRMLENAGVEPDACSSGGYRNLEPPTLHTNYNDGITSTQKERKVIGNPKYNSPFVKFKEKMTGTTNDI